MENAHTPERAREDPSPSNVEVLEITGLSQDGVCEARQAALQALDLPGLSLGSVDLLGWSLTAGRGSPVYRVDLRVECWSATPC